jgi:hypothetical protein
MTQADVEARHFRGVSRTFQENRNSFPHRPDPSTPASTPALRTEREKTVEIKTVSGTVFISLFLIFYLNLTV